MTASRFERFYPLFLLVLVAIGSWWWNHHFGLWTRPDHLAKMNDVPNILQGFERTPDFWRDSWKWWHGPWIQEGIGAYRPLSSILLWLECFVGQKFGFEWVARFGIVMLSLVSYECVLLARQFTRSRGAMLVAALLAPSARFWLMGASAPDYWLAWFAGHHDLLMIAFLLGALLFWTRWLESQKRRDLGWSLALFGLGVLSKEFLYIFPAMALGIALFHPHRKVELRRALTWVGAMFGFLAIAWTFRSLVLPHAYNPPPLKIVHFLRRPFLYWFPSFYKYIPATEFFPALLAFWLFASVGLGLRFRRQMPRLVRVIVWPLTVLAGALALASCFSGIGEEFWYFAESNIGSLHLSDLAQMIFTFWALSAIWKYRHQVPTIPMLCVFLLAYVPVWTYLGWHYTLAGWFVRAAIWWPMLWHLARLDFLKWPRVESEATRSQLKAQAPSSA